MTPEPELFAVRLIVPPAVPPKVTGTVQVVPLPVGGPMAAVAPAETFAVNDAAVTPVTASLNVRLKFTLVLVFVPTVKPAIVGGVVSPTAGMVNVPLVAVPPPA